MKFVTVRQNDEEMVGVLIEGRGIVPLYGCNLPYASMNQLIANITDYEMKFLKRISEEYQELIPLDAVDWCAPIPEPKQDVICVGLNYADHVKNAEKFSKEGFHANVRDSAVYFSKRVSVSKGDGENIVLPQHLSQQYDYEAELAVILGKDAYSIKKEDAKNYIFGYTILNDMTARNIQLDHKQWYYGKSLNGFTPMGPCIVTADEFSYPPVVSIESRVNGQLRQHGSSKNMIYGISEIIADLSQGMTLKAGTIISTGTPKGTAMEGEKPVFLRPGDVVACTIQGIGILTNTMVDYE